MSSIILQKVTIKKVTQLKSTWPIIETMPPWLQTPHTTSEDLTLIMIRKITVRYRTKILINIIFKKLKQSLVESYLRRAASKEALMEDYENASSVPTEPSNFMHQIQRSREILNASRDNLDHLGVEVSFRG